MHGSQRNTFDRQLPFDDDTPATSSQPAVVDPTADTEQQQIERKTLDLLMELLAVKEWLDNVAAAGLQLANDVLEAHQRCYVFPDDLQLTEQAHKLIELVDNAPGVPGGGA